MSSQPNLAGMQYSRSSGVFNTPQTVVGTHQGNQEATGKQQELDVKMVEASFAAMLLAANWDQAKREERGNSLRLILDQINGRVQGVQGFDSFQKNQFATFASGTGKAWHEVERDFERMANVQQGINVSQASKPQKALGRQRSAAVLDPSEVFNEIKNDDTPVETQAPPPPANDYYPRARSYPAVPANPSFNMGSTNRASGNASLNTPTPSFSGAGSSAPEWAGYYAALSAAADHTPHGSFTIPPVPQRLSAQATLPQQPVRRPAPLAPQATAVDLFAQSQPAFGSAPAEVPAGSGVFMNDLYKGLNRPMDPSTETPTTTNASVPIVQGGPPIVPQRQSFTAYPPTPHQERQFVQHTLPSGDYSRAGLDRAGTLPLIGENLDIQRQPLTALPTLRSFLFAPETSQRNDNADQLEESLVPRGQDLVEEWTVEDFGFTQDDFKETKTTLSTLLGTRTVLDVEGVSVPTSHPLTARPAAQDFNEFIQDFFELSEATAAALVCTDATPQIGGSSVPQAQPLAAQSTVKDVRVSQAAVQSTNRPTSELVRTYAVRQIAGSSVSQALDSNAQPTGQAFNQSVQGASQSTDRATSGPVRPAPMRQKEIRSVPLGQCLTGQSTLQDLHDIQSNNDLPTSGLARTDTVPHIAESSVPHARSLAVEATVQSVLSAQATFQSTNQATSGLVRTNTAPHFGTQPLDFMANRLPSTNSGAAAQKAHAQLPSRQASIRSTASSSSVYPQGMQASTSMSSVATSFTSTSSRKRKRRVDPTGEDQKQPAGPIADENLVLNKADDPVYRCFWSGNGTTCRYVVNKDRMQDHLSQMHGVPFSGPTTLKCEWRPDPLCNISCSGKNFMSHINKHLAKDKPYQK